MKADFDIRSLHPQNPAFQRAALTLHAMAESDRQWLMARLTPSQAARLHPLLAELRDLGLPCDPDLVSQALCAEPPLEEVGALHLNVEAGDSDVGEDPTSDEWRAGVPVALAHASAHDLSRMLAQEPPALVAHLLHVHPWPWAADLLTQLPSGQRQRVEAHLTRLRESLTASPPHALHQALVQAVMRRMPDLPPVPALEVASDPGAVREAEREHRSQGPWGRLRAWVRSHKAHAA